MSIYLGKPPKVIEDFLWNKILHFTATDDIGAEISLEHYVSRRKVSDVSNLGLEYSIDRGAWTNLAWNGDNIHLSKGHTVYIRNKSQIATVSSSSNNFYIFVMTGGTIAGGGSIQYILDKNGNRNDVQQNCYTLMFNGCTSLTTAPQLPATQLASGCYNCMFSGCTSLTTAPQLPATQLASGCYTHMFSECNSLTTAPQLPATNLTNSCYKNMFNNCISLKEIDVRFNNWLETRLQATFYWIPGNVQINDKIFRCPQSLIDNTESRSSSTVPESWTLVRND